MSAVERPAWDVTIEFLRGNGVTVDRINPNGIPVFNCLKYTDIENGIMLTRAIESNPTASFSLEFKRKAAEGETVVSVTCKLVTASPEQLEGLLLQDDYFTYGQGDTIRVARVEKVRLGNPTLAIHPFREPSFKSLGLTTGGVRSLARSI